MIRSRAMTFSTRRVRFTLVALAWLSITAGSAEAQAQSESGIGRVLQSNTTAREPLPEVAALEQDLLALTRQPDAELARTLLDTARAALTRARTLHQGGQLEATQRATQIASAALAAATYTLARHHAEAGLAAMRRRKDAATTAAAAARSALTHAQAQHSAMGQTP